MVEKIEGFDDVYMVDTYFLDRSRYDASYIVDSEKKAVIETGASIGRQYIFDGLEELGINYDEIDLIIPTHLHLDHAGGAGYLAQRCDNAEIVCLNGWAKYLSDPNTVEKLVESVNKAVGSLADEYGDIKPIDSERFITVEEGDIVDLDSKELEVLEAPGHAPHQFCLYEKTDEALFVGDEAGVSIRGEIIATTPPPNFDLETNLESLEKFRSYSPEMLLYTHYGSRTDVEYCLDKYRDVLTRWVEKAEDIWRNTKDEKQAIEEIIDRDHLFYELWDKQRAKETLRTDAKGVLRYIKNSG